MDRPPATHRAIVLECPGLPSCGRLPYHLPLSMIDDVPGRMRLGTLSLHTPWIVVPVHTAFVEYTPEYRVSSCSDWPEMSTSGRSRTHLIQSGRLTPGHLQNIAGACSPRGNRVEATLQGFDSNTPRPPIFVLPVSPSHRSVPRAFDSFTIQAIPS